MNLFLRENEPILVTLTTDQNWTELNESQSKTERLAQFTNPTQLSPEKPGCRYFCFSLQHSAKQHSSANFL